MANRSQSTSFSFSKKASRSYGDSSGHISPTTCTFRPASVQQWLSEQGMSRWSKKYSILRKFPSIPPSVKTPRKRMGKERPPPLSSS